MPKKTVKADVKSTKRPEANTIFIDKLHQVLFEKEVKKVESLKLAFAFAKKVPESIDAQKARAASAALAIIAELNNSILKSFAKNPYYDGEYKKQYAVAK